MLKKNGHGLHETRIGRDAEEFFRAGSSTTDGNKGWLRFACVTRPHRGYTQGSNDVFRRTHYTVEAKRLNDLGRGLSQGGGLLMPTDVACARCEWTTLVDHVIGCPRKGKSTIGGFCKYRWTVIMTRAHYRRYFKICLPKTA